MAASNAFYSVECSLLPRFKKVSRNSSNKNVSGAPTPMMAPNASGPATPRTPHSRGATSSAQDGSVSSSSSSSDSSDDEGPTTTTTTTGQEEQQQQQQQASTSFGSLKPLFTVRAWTEAPNLRLETDSSGGPRTPWMPHLLHAAGKVAETIRAWIAGDDEDADDTDLNNDEGKNNNNNSRANDMFCSSSPPPSTVRRHVVWSNGGGQGSAVTVIFAPIAGEFIFVVRVACAHSSIVVQQQKQALPTSSASGGPPTKEQLQLAATPINVLVPIRVFSPLTEQDAVQFAEHALFTLTTDVPLHTIVPQGWLGGTACASGRDVSVPLETLLSNSSSYPSSGKTNHGSQRTASGSKHFLHEVRRRIEICSAWWVQQQRSMLGSAAASLRLVETTGAALRASTDTMWNEKLHFALQGKFHLPFSVAVSPLTWTPANVAPSQQQNSSSSGDSTTRYVEDGWLAMQGRSVVVGAAPMLDSAKRAALFHAITLVGSSVQELVSHIGDLCAAPPGAMSSSSSSGGGGYTSGGNTLAKPVIPPVVVFDLDVTGWLLAAPRSDTALSPFSDRVVVSSGEAATGGGRGGGGTSSSSAFAEQQRNRLLHPYQPSTTQIPGWQDATAWKTATNPRATRHRVVVAYSAGGAFAPKGFALAFLLTSSHCNFVGMPMPVARDVARAAISEASALWESCTEESAAAASSISGTISSGNSTQAELRQLYDQYGLLVHAVMSSTCNNRFSDASSSSSRTSYLVGGGTAGAIRSSLGPPRATSIDISLDGSRKLNEAIGAAHSELYGDCRRGQPVAETPFHEEVLNKLLSSGVLSSYAAVSQRQGAAAASRQVFTLAHPLMGGQQQQNEKEKSITRRVMAVVSPEKGDVLGAIRVAIFSVPRETVSDVQSLHLGRLLPIH